MILGLLHECSLGLDVTTKKVKVDKGLLQNWLSYISSFFGDTPKK